MRFTVPYMLAFQQLWRWVVGFVCLLAYCAAAPAQQREPVFEIYGLTGAYFHGNLSIARQWRPQFGAGALAPLGRNWGILFDVTTSAVEARWNPDGSAEESRESNFARERRVALMPSIVRLWRRERFSIYAGGALGFEHERQRSRVRPTVGHDANGRPILADNFQDAESTRTDAMLVLRFGTLVSLAPKVVLRGGFSWLPRYTDERASSSLEIGVGYRL
jgi:hypothetical protein